uniref:NADH dehydrogenase subunit 6 n=1 Tax=Schlechtendalia chinensis TaxID=38111 RepID=A0A343AMV0_9HEMI|nr:NADH dehydrogenase subunit 6 [Schlechtendalia chinensis]API68537.1 NADH dehydrogenase subunit 6 [Schlechtendalia chinensis]
MLIKTILIMNLILAINLTTIKSPLKSNLMILFQSITLTMMINLINKTSWISFMIFILYIGGLMIIFLYISSIAFNEINNNKKKTYLIKIILLTFLFTYWFNSSMLLENFKFNNNYLFEDNFYLMNMFNYPNNLMIYFIMLILFIMLIMIIWMLKFNKGPIRQKI